MWFRSGDRLVERLCERCSQLVIASVRSDICPLCGGQLLSITNKIVDCPVQRKKVSYSRCFGCSDFIGIVSGRVDCKALYLPIL
jgi:uncharacterized protein with PIN domain